MSREDEPLLATGRADQDEENTPHATTVSRDDAPSLDAGSRGDQDEENANSPTPESEDSLSPEEAAILTLMKRLRFLFGLITLPIVPLGILAAFSLLWFLFTAFVLDNYRWLSGDFTAPPQTCSHPLRAYAGASLGLALYAPYHGRVRDYLTSRSFRGRTLLSARRADQIFHTVALVYVYAGMTLLQTCRDDVPRAPLDSTDSATVMNSCHVTCPRLTRAFTLYVKILGLFTLAVMLPLLSLPCIYVWFLRQATSVVSSGSGGADALAALQQRLQDERGLDDTVLLGLSGAANSLVRPTADQVWRQLRHVQLTRHEVNGKDVLLVEPLDGPSGAAAATPQQLEYGPVECCICMTVFSVQNDITDVEEGSDHAAMDESIVQTVACGHLFHEHCLINWMFGQRGNQRLRVARPESGMAAPNGTLSDNADNSDSPVDATTEPAVRSTLRARRTTCPLCRAELVEREANPTSRYNTFD